MFGLFQRFSRIAYATAPRFTSPSNTKYTAVGIRELSGHLEPGNLFQHQHRVSSLTISDVNRLSAAPGQISNTESASTTQYQQLLDRAKFGRSRHRRHQIPVCLTGSGKVGRGRQRWWTRPTPPRRPTKVKTDEHQASFVKGKNACPELKPLPRLK